jgi:chromosome partitioning protein
MIILVGGEKGGTGKSTISTNLAAIRTIDGGDVLLYDIDPQRTSTFWASRRDENGIHPRIASSQKVLDSRVLNPGMIIRNELKSLKDKYSDIIIDAGGAASEVLRAAMTIADVLVIPLMPSSFDVWTLGTMNNIISEVKTTNPDLKVIIVYNKVAPNPHAAKSEITDSDEILNDFEYIKRSKVSLVYRIAIRRSQGQGLSIIEFKPSDEKSIGEMKKIYKEVFND